MFTLLHFDVIQIIFSYFSTKEILYIAPLCKSFYDLIKKDSLYVNYNSKDIHSSLINHLEFIKRLQRVNYSSFGVYNRCINIKIINNNYTCVLADIGLHTRLYLYNEANRCIKCVDNVITFYKDKYVYSTKEQILVKNILTDKLIYILDSVNAYNIYINDTYLVACIGNDFLIVNLLEKSNIRKTFVNYLSFRLYNTTIIMIMYSNANYELVCYDITSDKIIFELNMTNLFCEGTLGSCYIYSASEKYVIVKLNNNEWDFGCGLFVCFDVETHNIICKSELKIVVFNSKYIVNSEFKIIDIDKLIGKPHSIFTKFIHFENSFREFVSSVIIKDNMLLICNNDGGYPIANNEFKNIYF